MSSRSGIARGAAAVALLVVIDLARAWTAPLIVSNIGTNYGLDPRIAPGFGGKLYLTWHQAGWGVYFRERSAGGTWSDITTLRFASTWSAETGVTEDSQYRPHVVYLEQDGAGARYLVHQYRSQGNWIRTLLSSGLEESVPCIDTDGAGRVHLVYAKGSNNQHYLYHRIWTSEGGWGPDIAIGTGAIESGRVGYHRPNIQTSGNDVHLAWIQPGGDRYVVRYRRFDGNTWFAGQTLGQTVNAGWMSSCRLAVADANTVVVTWSRDAGTSSGALHIFYAVSTDRGVTWSPEQMLAGSDTAPANMYGRGGRAYLVSLSSPAVNLYTWANGAWNAGERVNPGELYFDGWGDVTQTIDGAIHAVYYHAVNSGNTSGGVDYVMQPPALPTGTVTGRVIDAVGPVPSVTVTSSLGGEASSDSTGKFTLTCPIGTASIHFSMAGYDAKDIANVPVTAGQATPLGDVLLSGLAPMSPHSGLVLSPGNTRIDLAWKNSPSVNFSSTLIVCRTDREPAGPTDGMVVADQPGYPGEAAGYAHTGLVNGTRLYYALFPHDNHPIRTYAAAVTGSATPALKIDHDSDGHVDQSDFGWFQTCLTGAYVPQIDPGCASARLDADEDVDLDDLLLFRACLAGPGMLAPADCLP
jgi:hypothetical protein